MMVDLCWLGVEKGRRRVGERLVFDAAWLMCYAGSGELLKAVDLGAKIVVR